MTMSLIARDRATGAFGVVIASSSPAVAARCAHPRAGVGVVASQNVTNPALGPAILDRLAHGTDAPSALAATLAEERFGEYRQVSVVDAQGNTAVHSGEKSLGTYHAVRGDGAVAAGNMLHHPTVIDALLTGYSHASGVFEERLLHALQAALAAGGEEGPVHSAGLLVVEDVPWPVTDLRIDYVDDDPLAGLRRLWELWQPQKADYRVRGVDPTIAPSYGVPGDL
ncbi:MAG: DUF1028 domain-containing protein [Gordonia sp. (in: high G+C Gram-positive bacteria)]